MNKINPVNERIKRDYFRFQTEAKQKSQATLNGIRKSIHRFESYNSQKDFSTFNKEQAIAFKKHFSQQKNIQTNEPISKATLLSTSNNLKEFFHWLAWQPGYKSKIHVPDIEYFNLTEKDESIARQTKLKNIATIEQIRHVLFNLPTENVIQRRDRALMAFTILTGMRDSAIASIKIKHIDQSKNPILVLQNPDEVDTKNSKQIFSYFLPVGDDIKIIVTDWLYELKTVHLYGVNGPVFPRTRLSHDENYSFKADGIEPTHWSNATHIRDFFKEAFISCGLPYFTPHTFRNTLVRLGEQICKTPEQFKAWSQNLGHENVLTTFISYGYVDTHRQGEVIGSLGMKSEGEDMKELMLQLSAKLDLQNKKA